MMSRPMLVFSVFLVIVLVCIVLLDDRPTPIRITKWQKRLGEKSSKWIVVTTVQEPTKDIKRLSRIPGWTLVVVGDTKTPKNWSLEGVHYLSVEHQQRCGELTLDFHEHILFEVDNAGYQILDYLPYKSYARKNIGYLYAIQNGAEWIYDTDDDNKPYGIINLEIILSQYRHEKSFWDPDWSSLTFLRRPVDFAMVANFKKNVKLNTTRGKWLLCTKRCYKFTYTVRFSPEKLFNPYSFFGNADMWPRGFPVEYIQHFVRTLNTDRTKTIRDNKIVVKG
ncbi:hypothetical protein ANCCEY_09021 [Ancylostoma ceylanicum]|uniref:Uncharacterized protein n=1 Tax=Ancylostoma ceylanicum TaxID=53326 RepID=A0A0D6LPF5_9BILA|nr:hypothetical protein ANCCEY_09021 [Ancylostoma ceylanicum]